MSSGGVTHWARPAGEVLAELGVDPSTGLSEETAAYRLRAFGPNRLRAAASESGWTILFNQVKSLIVALLAAACALSLAFGDFVEAAAIGVVIALNTLIGFFTELRACRSMEALRRLGTRTARVRRAGGERTLPAAELVPGDIVLLDGGDVLTADLRIIESSKLAADESALTGESVPVGKRVEPVDAGAALAEQRSMLFKGTSITRGSGAGVVVETGMSTQLGRITALVDEAEQEVTPLEKRLEALGRRLVWVTLAVATLSTVVGALSGKDAFLMIETGIALAVAAIPEGLPIVATIALARGMWRMAQRNALINRLSAVETLGATSVVFTDKTGTLTENKLTVERVEPTEREREALEIAVLCNNATDSVGDPLEVALIAAGKAAGIERAALLQQMPEVREEPFDPETRMMATVHRRDAGYVVAVKGAAEAVVSASTLGEPERAEWLERNETMAAAGLRVLAVARKRVDRIDAPPYADLEVVGLIGMHDPPRADVRQAIEACRRAGIRVVMVTGDQPLTARAVAHAVGLVDDPEAPVLLGRDLRDGADDADVSICARVDPEQKLSLIARHQARGEVVAMTGDGVNDAPALKKADIGIAMGRRGTEVAREASEMILKDDAFSSIVYAVHQGRVIFDNIRKFVLYLLSCNVSEIMIVAGGSMIAGAPLPLLPLQILFLNLVTDVFPALALGFGEGEPGIERAPPRDPNEPILAQRHWWLIAGYASMITAVVLVALLVSLGPLGFEPRRAVTVSFLTLSLAQLWHVFNVRGPHAGWLRNDVTTNPWVWAAIGLCVALVVGAVYIPVIAGPLKLVDPGVEGWLLVVGMSLAVWFGGQISYALRRFVPGTRSAR